MGGRVGRQLRQRDSLRLAARADRLPNGNTLITDSHNNRFVEVTPEEKNANNGRKAM